MKIEKTRDIDYSLNFPTYNWSFETKIARKHVGELCKNLYSIIMKELFGGIVAIPDRNKEKTFYAFLWHIPWNNIELGIKLGVRFEMKIGIIGLGSIGQRHVRCLKELGYSDIVALRTKKGTMKQIPDDLDFVKEVYDVKEFYDKKLDGVIIANPTSLHITSMKEALERDLPIFVEKPISNSLTELNEIKKYDTSKVMVGFCLRFHEITESVKKFLAGEKLELLLPKILKEQEKLNSQVDMWEELKKEDAPLVETLKQIPLEKTLKEITKETSLEMRDDKTGDVIEYRKLFTLKI